MNNLLRPDQPYFFSAASRRAHQWLVLLVLGFSTGILPAATTRTWTGGSATSGNWTSAANWANGVPVAGDILNFVDSGARKASNTNNFPAGTRFSTLNLFGDGWRLRGNAVAISNYVGQGSPTGVSIVDLDITAVSPGVGLTIRTFNSADRLTFNGDIQLGNRTLTTEGPGDIVVAGTISGAGGIAKNNNGDLTLAGFGANSFTGDTYVNAGILRLGRYLLGGINGIALVGTTAIPGDLIIGGFGSTLIGDVVALSRDHQIANTSVVHVNATGSLELGASDDTIGELRLRGGTVLSTTGTLSVDGGIMASLPVGVTKNSLIAGYLALGSRGDGAQVVDVAQSATLNITAEVSGVSTVALVKTNRGDLWLTKSNVFSGDVIVAGGILGIKDGRALGNTTGLTRLTLGRLELDGTFGVPEALEVANAGGVLEVSSGSSSWLGSIVLEDNLSVITAPFSTLSVVGAISGPAGWTKIGDGTLQFKTPHTNSYAGVSWVREGKFIMDGVMNQPVVPGPLHIGNGTDPTNSTRAWLIKQNQIADHSLVTLNRSGVLELAVFNDAIGGLVFNGGAVETTSGTLTLNGDILVHATNETARLHGKLSLGGATRTIYTMGSSNTPDLNLTAAISDGGGAAGLNKVGEGSVRLSGVNSFMGLVSVTDGQLRIAHPSALGSSVGGTEVTGIDGARLVLESAVGMTITGEPLTLNSTAPGLPVGLENFAGNNQWNGPIHLAAPESVVSVPHPFRPLGLGGAMTGPGGLRKIGLGQLRLEGFGVNSFSGLTTVAEGDLILDKPFSQAINGDLTIGDGIGGANADRVLVQGGGDEIGNASRVIINGSGLLQVNSVLDLVGSIEGAGNIVLSTVTSGLIAGRNDLSTTFQGTISGAGSFEKVGAGTLTLTGTHAYTGESGVAEGTLVVDGSIAASAAIQINRPLIPNNSPPAILAGNGFVPRLLPHPGGTVAPGTSPGRLTVQGLADLAQTDLRLELNGTVAGAGYDQLRVAGDVKLQQSKLSLAAGFVPSTNDVFVVLEKTTPGPIDGFFLNANEGAILGVGIHQYRITYQGGDGNDVVLRRVEFGGPALTGIQPLTSERMAIRGQGVPFGTYILEATPHVHAPTPWTPIATNNANAQGIYEFIDAYAAGGSVLYPSRFYRVLSP
jgi:fibronectin-binding autotransporter adhesin